MSTQTKKITVDTAALFVGRVVGLLLGIVRFKYLTTYLGVTDFGLLTSATYFVSIFLPLFDLGISQLLTREIARNISRGNTLLGQALLLKLCIAGASSLAVGAATAIVSYTPETQRAIFLTTIAMAITSVSTAYLSALQAQRRMIAVSAMNMFSDVVLSAGVILVLPYLTSVNTVLVMTIAVAVLNLLVLIILYHRLSGPVSLSGGLASWREMLREGFPIAVSSFGISLYMFIGPNILKYVRGDAEVGIFGAGYKVISILTLIPVVLTQIIYPVFSDFTVNAPHKLGKALQDALRAMAEISVPLAVGTAILAPGIIHLLASPEFADAAIVLRIVIVGNAFGYLAWILNAFLLATGHQRFCMWNALAVAVIVLAASIVFIPLFGYTATAAIAGGTDIVLCAVSMIYVRHQGYPLLQLSTLLKIASSAAVMGIAVFFLRSQHIVIAVTAGVVVYAACLLMTGTLGDQEKELLRKVIAIR